MKITAVVLTKNEQNTILNCLKSLSFTDAIIIIDNESDDDTLKIARKFTEKILSFKGTDFSKARALGKEKAGAGWLLYIDADEIVTPTLASEIRDYLNEDFAAFEIIRKNYFY